MDDGKVKFENGYIVFETTSFSDFVVCKSISISSNDLTLNYKESKKLDVTTENADGYTVVYSSKNEKIAKVSDDGKVTALKRGTTVITATIVDSNGNEVASDTCKVTVNYTSLQWFIVIVLFGWIWY